MASPTVDHEGFLVPNAGGLKYPRMAEVDQIDFNTLSQAGWGVIEGCRVTLSGSTATVQPGLVVVGGKLVSVVSALTVPLGSGFPYDRFDLVVITAGGTIKVDQGLAVPDPVLPDPKDDETVLAAVFCPTGTTDYGEYVIDKRVMLPQALYARKTPTEPLIRNVDSTGSDVFSLRGDGKIMWGIDTSMYRETEATLRVDDNINVGKTLRATRLSADTLYTSGPIDTQNFYSSDSTKLPEMYGAIRTNPLDGRAYIYTRDFGWQEMATARNSLPLGSVLQTVQTPAEMGQGWLLLNGQTVDETRFPTLWTLSEMLQYSSGTAPNRVMTVPNLIGKVITATATGIGPGTGADKVTLVEANLPPHKHGVSTTDDGGSHTPTEIRTSAENSHSHSQEGNSGQHGHPVTDPGHKHDGMEGPGGVASSVVALFWGGRNKIDALFNDRNHTYSVEKLDWTRPAVTGITIGASGSEHSHIFKPVPAHDHKITFNAVAGHKHPITENLVGSATQFSVRQAEFTFFVYLKV